MPLLLLPKSRPLSWVGIWSAARRAAFLFLDPAGDRNARREWIPPGPAPCALPRFPLQ